MSSAQTFSHNKRLIFILITMFLNFLGFSIIIPILPFLVAPFIKGANDTALLVGLLMSSYALCQFLAAPGLGMLSDRFGRRPILLLSLFGSVIGYLVMTVPGSLVYLFLGRIIDGLTGGNISTVFAYIADITEPKDRGKYYGMLGAAGGFGFMVGPAVGGITASIHLTTPLYLAAAITLLNMVWGYFVLPESLSHEHRMKTISISHVNPFGSFGHIFQQRILRLLFLLGFIFFFALTGMQGISSVSIKDVLGWNASGIGFLLFFVGIIDIVAQGFIARKLLGVIGDINTTTLGLFLNGLGYVVIALLVVFPSPFILYLGVIISVVGDGLVEPSLAGLISNAADKTMQGRIQGANQSMQAIARVVGPLYAAGMYLYGRNLPYIGNAILVAICLAVVTFFFSNIKEHRVQASA